MNEHEVRNPREKRLTLAPDERFIPGVNHRPMQSSGGDLKGDQTTKL